MKLSGIIEIVKVAEQVKQDAALIASKKNITLNKIEAIKNEGRSPKWEGEQIKLIRDAATADMNKIYVQSSQVAERALSQEKYFQNREMVIGALCLTQQAPMD